MSCFSFDLSGPLSFSFLVSSILKLEIHLNPVEWTQGLLKRCISNKGAMKIKNPTYVTTGGVKLF